MLLLSHLFFQEREQSLYTARSAAIFVPYTKLLSYVPLVSIHHLFDVLQVIFVDFMC